MFLIKNEINQCQKTSIFSSGFTIDTTSAVMSQFLRNLTNQGYDTRVRPTKEGKGPGYLN